MSFLAKWAYDIAYRISSPRWDNNQVPPEVIAIASELPKNGRVLDLGCGTGTSSVYLAHQGLRVTGLDFSAKAIEMAKARARQERVDADFRVADVTQLDFLTESFDLILDVGCLHGINAKGRQDYARHVARLTHAGSKLLLWAFTGQNFGIGVQPNELHALFSSAFDLERVEHGYFHERSSDWYWFIRKP
ncbi:MAG: class I SAM-dependent methyltransferase [Chloroflexi bacterium CFX2]|nr:class I SAM-dependent methyltransferase [Chloroflexi bacterium CFX2]